MSDTHSAGSARTRTTFQEREEMMTNEPWKLSPHLFGDRGAEIHDFEMYDYTYLLNHARSRGDLIQGLRELSPFADDALEVAERIDDRSFYKFKLALLRERQISRRGEVKGAMFPKYDALLFPRRFIMATQLAEKWQVSLGAALIRVMEIGRRE